MSKTTTVISGFILSPKEWSEGSFQLTDPSSNNTESGFTYVNLTPNIISLADRTVTLLRIGAAIIRVNQDASTNYTSGSADASFDVLTSIVRPGVSNQLDLSWNIPTENGATIKNYFFYNEERQFTDTTTRAPSISTILTTIPATNASYYSYKLPFPYSAKILSANRTPSGIDVNTLTLTNINISPSDTSANYFDLGYYGEIEVNWEYHADNPIVELKAGTAATTNTTMTISLYKEASANEGDNRADLISSVSRVYDSLVNCFGPMPQNNYKTMTDIFPIVFPGVTNRELKYLKYTDVVSGRVSLSSNTYIPADNPNGIRSYSIIIKSIRIAPFRFPISRDFTSLPRGQGVSTAGVGFSVSTHNALVDPSSSDISGVLYHMPKMTQPLADFGKANWTISWNYSANLSKLASDISYLPVDISANINIPFHLRVCGYSRPYAKTYTSILDASYNTTTIADFLSTVAVDPSYNTRLLFDVSFTEYASYAKIAATAAQPDASFGIVSRSFDISGAEGFTVVAAPDFSHSQFVFLFQLTITDPSYNHYFRSMMTETDAFAVKMLSQTFTPHQVYRFAGPDPTLASSHAIGSPTNTVFDIVDYYTQIRPNYSFFNLTNGVFYSYKIAGQNKAGSSAFSDILTRRCGSIPNQIVNRVNNFGTNTLTIESERTSNRVNIYWEKPAFTGYEIQYFEIQTAIDISGRWVNSLEYTPDISSQLVSFTHFDDTTVYVTDETKTGYDKTMNSYRFRTVAAQQYINAALGLNTPFSGSFLNGYKYYFHLASVNELGRSAYSKILSGIPFARPDNSPIQFVGTPIIGNQVVIFTWKIPQNDAGSPILNYIIDYQTVDDETTIPIRYSGKTRYIQNAVEHGLFIQPNRNYPFDYFRSVYTDYKNLSALSPTRQNEVIALRNQLSQFVIHPRPITINNTDRFLSTVPDVSNNIILNYTSQTFSYKSVLLNQNVFDLSNIQLLWYYTEDTVGGSTWVPGITSSFHLSIRGHLEHNSNDRSRDISGIFDISQSYIVNSDRLSSPNISIFNYINHISGNVIEVGGSTPAKIVALKSLQPSTMYRIDANNGDGYYLKLEYTISNISRSDYRFIFYSGRIILNGVAPVRTSTELNLNTEFTVTLRGNEYSPFVNGKKYLFTITPFNINDFFPDQDLLANYGTGRSQTTIIMGTEFSSPITDMSYSLISTGMGGKVTLQWKYTSIAQYYINIQIPNEYRQDNIYPEEYPVLLQPDGTSRSILTPYLERSGGIVSYSIPSSLPADIASSNAQLYLKAGRAYQISVASVQGFINNQNETQFIPGDVRDINAENTYIVPFRTPLAPLSLSALGYDGTITLMWKLPDFTADPNYYITDQQGAYYRYKYFTLERRDISSVDVGLREWHDVSNDIFIPTAENGGVAGYQAVFQNISGTNELPIQFRVRCVLVNEYNMQRVESAHTYMSMVNELSVFDNSLNSSVYPSLYPYTPSVPVLQAVSRGNTSSGALTGLNCRIIYPSYNGNADFYECHIEYTVPSGVPGSGVNWYNVFDVNNGIADISLNITANPTKFTTNGRLRTLSATSEAYETIEIICRSTVIGYGIRYRLYPRKTGLNTGNDGFYPIYGASLYSEYSNLLFISI
jgi:hypothetical protein